MDAAMRHTNVPCCSTWPCQSRATCGHVQVCCTPGGGARFCREARACKAAQRQVVVATRGIAGRLQTLQPPAHYIAACILWRPLLQPLAALADDTVVYNAVAQSDFLRNVTGVLYATLLAFFLYRIFSRRSNRFRSEVRPIAAVLLPTPPSQPLHAGSLMQTHITSSLEPGWLAGWLEVWPCAT